MGGSAAAGTDLETVNEQKDIGVLVNDTLKLATHCVKAANKANNILGQVSRSFQYREIHMNTAL